MARILGYIASRLDGFIATPEHGLDWLFKHDQLELGEHDDHLFLHRIRTVVTYDFLAADPGPWPYAEQRVVVVTSRPIEHPKGPLETRSDIDALVAELRALDDGDVWMLGGGQLQMAFLQRGALDELEVYVMPEIIGGGYPLFPASGLRASPTLLSAKVIEPGCVRMHYRFD